MSHLGNKSSTPVCCVYVYAKSLHLCPTLWPCVPYPTRLLCPWEAPFHSGQAFKKLTSWLQPHLRPGAGSTKISCFQIPDPQKLEGINKCLLFQASCFGVICDATIEKLYPTALDSGFQLCLAKAQKVRWVCLFLHILLWSEFPPTVITAPSGQPQGPPELQLS